MAFHVVILTMGKQIMLRNQGCVALDVTEGSDFEFGILYLH